ncbi:hypothetical protein BJ742DRAFT_774823 [Cladochytrium replicatum]|nr:hypothetical protein BJ742DRAFT_774823 [Cladochytrium replicatum]
MDETGAVFRKSPLRMRMRPQAQGQRHQQLPPGDQHFRGPRDKPPTGMSQPMGIGPAEREPKRRRRNRDRGTGGTTLDFSSSSTDAIGISSARDGRAHVHCKMSSLRDSDKICPNEMDTVRSSLRNIIDKADIDEVMLSDEDMRRQHLSIITLLKALLTQFPPLFFWSKAGNEAEDNPMQITADNQQFHCWTVSRIIHFLVDPSNLASANLATDFLRTLFELGSFDPVTSRSLMDVLDGLMQ